MKCAGFLHVLETSSKGCIKCLEVSGFDAQNDRLAAS